MPPMPKKGWVASRRRARRGRDRRRAPGFGRRLPDRSDADVVDGRPAAAAICSSEWVERPTIASAPSSSAPPRRKSRPDRHGLRRRRSCGPGRDHHVVEDEEGAVGVTDAAEGGGGALDLSPVPAPSRAAGRCRRRQLSAARSSGSGLLGAAGAGVADEVEARRAQALAAQRTGGLGGGKAHPTIMKRDATAPGLRPPAGG